MNLDVLTLWIELDPIRYLIVATVIVGLMNCIKILVKGR